MVIQSDDFNGSSIQTVVVCELTTVLKRGKDPGNVLLVPGEGGLPEHSVVNVSRIVTLDKGILGDKVGTLDADRMRQVMKGVYLVLDGADPDP